MKSQEYSLRPTLQGLTNGGSLPAYHFSGARVNGSKPIAFEAEIPGTPLGDGRLVGDEPARVAGGSSGEHGAAGAYVDANGELKIPGWKRTLDLICILIALPFLAVVMVFVAVWIKLSSPGPIFFRQTRVGLGGRSFGILKFRSMRTGAETKSHEAYCRQLIESDAPMVKLDSSGDSRLIAGGRILRATGLDELPQLWNVVRGEMSLVGPRPCIPGEFEHYQDWQRARVNAAPGLTGYWQVNGKNKTTFKQMIEMDLEYVDRMSLRLDLAILLHTVPAIATQVLESRMKPAAVRDRGAQNAASQAK